MNEPTTRAAGPSHRPRVLLVEDNDAAGRGLSKLLEAHGFDVRVVSDGASALAVLRDHPPPDFLLTDLQLPDLDGREVAREAHRLQPPPKVAVITGWDLPADPVEYARWGIDWVFCKPVDVRDLISKLGDPKDVPPAETPPR